MLSSILSGRVVSDSELQNLKQMIPDGNKRMEILEDLEGRFVGTVIVQESKNFEILCDILGEIVEEFEYDEDFDALRRIYQVSSCISVGDRLAFAVGCKLTAKGSLETRNWSNEMFWAQSIVDLVRKDMNLWSKIAFIIRENRIDDIRLFGQLTGSQIRAFLVLTRIQAAVASMRTLDISNETIAFILQEISAQFGLENVGINLTLTDAPTPSAQFLQRLLSIACQLFLPALSERAKKSTVEPKKLWETMYSVLSVQSGQVAFQPKNYPTTLQHQLGYSPLLELVFCLYVQSIKAHTQPGSAPPQSAKEQAQMLEPLTQLAQPTISNNMPVPSLTTCFCGCSIQKWSFLDSHRCVDNTISPKLQLILTAVAAGQDPRVLNEKGEIFAPPTRARSNSGRFNLAQLQNAMSFYANSRSEVPAAEGGGPAALLTGQALVQRVLPHMMCERCYRHLLAPPLTVNPDTIQCVGMVPLSVQPTPLAVGVEEVTFEQAMCCTPTAVSSGGSGGDGSGDLGPGDGAQGIDFGLFDKNLSALLKGQGQGANRAEDKKSGAGDGDGGAVKSGASRDTRDIADAKAAPVEDDESEDILPATSMPPRHGLEGHRIRNSRDLTRKAVRPVSLLSVTSTASSTSGADSARSDELNVLQGVQELSADLKARNDRYVHRALPPDPTLSPTAPRGARSPAGAVVGTGAGAGAGTGAAVSSLLPTSPTPAAPTIAKGAVTPGTPLAPLAASGIASPASAGGLITPPPGSGSAKIPPPKDAANAKKAAIDLLVPFIEQLWEGLAVKIIYSSKPLVEKTRILYLRAGQEKANKAIRDRLVPIGTEVTEAQRQYTHQALLDAVAAAVPLQLCWGRRSVMGSVSFSSEKCLDLDTIKHIKVGSGAWAQCINIGSSTGKALVLRFEEEGQFAKVLEGLTMLVESRKS